MGQFGSESGDKPRSSLPIAPSNLFRYCRDGWGSFLAGGISEWTVGQLYYDFEFGRETSYKASTGSPGLWRSDSREEEAKIAYRLIALYNEVEIAGKSPIRGRLGVSLAIETLAASHVDKYICYSRKWSALTVDLIIMNLTLSKPTVCFFFLEPV